MNNHILYFAYFDENWWYADPEQGDPRWVFDNKVKQEQIDWHELRNFIIQGGHYACSQKETTPMFNCTRFKTIEEGAIESRGYPRKVKDNAISVSALILDYDREEAPTITQFKQLYGDFEWLLYTSYNHLRKKEHSYCEQYRVLLPLEVDLPSKMLEKSENLDPSQKTVYPALLEYFFGTDASCFQPFRSFYLPSCPANMLSKAKVEYNKGKLFDWRTLPVEYGTQVPYVPRRRTGTVSGKGKILYNTFDIVQFFRDEGLYIRPKQYGKHDVRCPLWTQHTGQDITGTCIWEGSATTMPGIKCHHHGGDLVNLKWLFDYYRELYGQDFFRQYCETEDPVEALLAAGPYKTDWGRRVWLSIKGVDKEIIASLGRKGDV
jgi:hypothetical protein